MAVVLGIDLGTSAVKVSAVSPTGEVVAQASEAYPLNNPQPGYYEQNPIDWTNATIAAIHTLLATEIAPGEVYGISFSGQMHSLVVLNQRREVIRPAILWNDTRSSEEAQWLNHEFGDKLIQITGNQALPGFTLTKLLWLARNETATYEQIAHIMLPKDYVRLQITDQIATDFSDAAGTLLFDLHTQQWSDVIVDRIKLKPEILPPLLAADAQAGTVTASFSDRTGLITGTPVFTGAADNAAGAIGAGVLNPDQGLVSIGTSGVVLKGEEQAGDYAGELQFEALGPNKRYYSMGVTLAAGYSLSWFKQTFAANMSFDELVALAETSIPGAHGLLFTPYIVGERTPHNDGHVRGSFIGIDSQHTLADFARAVFEGITYSLNDIFKIYEQAGTPIHQAVAIGGGAKSAFWLQLQADIFNVPVIQLANEQGPGMGAAVLAAVGLGWFGSVDEAAQSIASQKAMITPESDAVSIYEQQYQRYTQIYANTKIL